MTTNSDEGLLKIKRLIEGLRKREKKRFEEREKRDPSKKLTALEDLRRHNEIFMKGMKDTNETWQKIGEIISG